MSSEFFKSSPIQNIQKREEQKIVQGRETQIAELNEINKVKLKAKKVSFCSFSRYKTLNVRTGYYAITNSSAPKHVVGSMGAGPCLIVGLYDSHHKIAMVAHMPAFTPPEFLSSILDLMDVESTEAYLVGGALCIDGSCDTCIKTYHFLKEKGVKIINADIARGNLQSYGCGTVPASLAIDAKTGDVFAPVKDTDLDETYSDDAIAKIEQTYKQQCTIL